MTLPTSSVSQALESLAQQSAHEVVASLRQTGPIAEILTKLAEECERAAISDLSRALALTQALVTTCDAAQECRARARRARAQALAYSNRFVEAEEILAEGIALALNAGELVEAAQCRLMSLHALARQGKFEKAIAIGDVARAAFVEAGETLHAARADINVGVTLRMQDKPAEAIARFDRARPGIAHVPMILAQLQSNRAEALLDLQLFEEARTAFAESLRAFEVAGARRAAAIVEGNLADLCGRQGRLDEALDHFERARRRFGEADSPGDAARLEVERAEALLQLGAAQDAERALRDALLELEPRGMALEAARARAALGRALLSQKKYIQAGIELGSARTGFDSLMHPTGVVRVRILLARALLGSDELDAARALIEEIASRTDLRPVELGEIAALSAVVFMRSGLPADSIAQIGAAITIARQVGLPVLLAELQQLAAWIHEQAGDRHSAIESLELAMDSIERVRSGLRGEQYRAVFSGAFSDVYEQFTRLWLDGGGSSERAIEVIERGRGRALHDIFNSGAGFSEFSSLSDDDSRLLHLRQALHTRIAALHHSLEHSRPHKLPDSALPSTQELENQLRDVEYRLAATRKFAGEFARPPTAAEIIHSVPAHGALVEYFWDGPDISACVVHNGNVEIVRSLCSQCDVRERMGALRLQISIATSRGIPQGEKGALLAHRANVELSRMGTLLLAPLQRYLTGAAEVAIIADDFLASVPFQCLVVNEASMLDIADVITAPSASTLAELSRRSIETGPGVVVGFSDADAPRAEEESLAIAQTMSAQRILVGKDATVARVKSALQGASNVHIASHARFVPQSPMQSALKLSDGWLTARDIYDIELRGGTVMLSACNSGRAGVSPGHELLGLVRAFMAAGSRSLVMSLWHLHDQTALDLLTSLYNLWYSQDADVNGPQHSLRLSQQQLRHKSPHVAAWGPLHVVGAWSRTHK